MIELRWWLPCSEFSWAVWPMPGSLYETHFSNSSLNLLENQQVSISIPTTDGLREHQRMLVGQRLEGHFNGSARAGFRCNYLPPPILAPSANLQRHIMSPNTTQLSIVTSQGQLIERRFQMFTQKKRGGTLFKLVDACILDSSFDLIWSNLGAKIFLTIQPLSTIALVLKTSQELSKIF